MYYPPEYVTQHGTTFVDQENMDIGKTLYSIISKYPETQNLIVDLMRKEGAASTSSEDRGLFSSLYSLYIQQDERTDNELLELASRSINSLENLQYLTAHPTLQMGGSYVAGQYLEGKQADPDTVMYSKPTRFIYGPRDPDTGKRMELSTDKMEGLNTLLHESLLHGANLYHPNTSFLIQESTRNYDETIDKLINILSPEDLDLLLNSIYSENQNTIDHIYPY